MNRRTFIKTMSLITCAIIINPIKIIKNKIYPDWKFKIYANGDFEIKDFNNIEEGGLFYKNGILSISGDVYVNKIERVK